MYLKWTSDCHSLTWHWSMVSPLLYSAHICWHDYKVFVFGACPYDHFCLIPFPAYNSYSNCRGTVISYCSLYMLCPSVFIHSFMLFLLSNNLYSLPFSSCLPQPQLFMSWQSYCLLQKVFLKVLGWIILLLFSDFVYCFH